MDAKELRIGNWIEAVAKMGNYYMRMTEHNFVDLAKNPDCANPIPLTPEILEKAGFDKIADDEFRKGRLTFELAKYESGYHVNIVIGGETLGWYEYLHQLQNLYWCLCGEELEINL